MSRLASHLLLTAVISSGFADEVRAASHEAVDAASRPGVTTSATGSIDLLDDALLELAQQSLDEGLAHEAAGNELAALEALRTAQEIVPDDAEIAFHLGRLLHRVGNFDGAERHYQQALQRDPTYIEVYLGLTDLALDRDVEGAALAQVAQRLLLARDLAGARLDVVVRQARVAARQQHATDAERYYREALALGPPSDALRVELGDFYRDMEDFDRALQWYRQVPESSPLASKARDRLRELEIELHARRFGWPQQTVAPSPAARRLVATATRLYRQQRLSEAERTLRQATALAPQDTETRVLLGDVLRAAGRREAAELEYLRGLAFDQGSAEVHERLGRLYLDQKGGNMAGEAVVLLTRALQLRPEHYELHLLLARALRQSGNLPAALREVRTYLEAASDDASRAQAEELQQTLERLLAQESDAEDPLLHTLTSPTSAGKRTLIEKLNRARAHLSRGDTGAAVAELRLLPRADRGPEVLKLEGRILHAAGQLQEAEAAFRSSLKLEPSQPGIHLQLGLVLAAQGRMVQARRHLLIAEGGGSQEATFHVARVDANATGVGLIASLRGLPALLSARSRLSRFVEQSTEALYLGPARNLRQEIDSRLRALGAVALLAALISLTALGLGVRLRWGGVGLQRLLLDHPEAGPEVQRVLSTIRHEVLKHNTLVVSGLVDAMETGQNASSKAAHLVKSLFGSPGEPAVMDRFRGYVGDLTQIGRVHGARLNLRRNDTAITPIYEGFAILRRQAGKLAGIQDLSPRQRDQLLVQLKQASRLLNTDGYRALQRLLHSLRVLMVEKSLLLRIFQRTCREPALADAPVAALQVETQAAMPVGLAIPGNAFEDILGNLFRNAIQSSMRESQTPVVIGLCVRSEVNAITGLERLVFGVRDRSPQPLTTEALQGQRVEGGLGLTVKLLTAYDGSLAVEAAPEGWAKEVVAKLPRAELIDDEG